MKRMADGTTVLFGWTGPFWLWHAITDGSRLCRCRHSVKCRQVREMIR